MIYKKMALAFMIFTFSVSSIGATVTCPANIDKGKFGLFKSDTGGVDMYTNDTNGCNYTNGCMAHSAVQVIDLSKGAGIKSLYSEPSYDVEGIEKFPRLTTSQFTLKSFSVVNGTYFENITSPVKLAYPVKENGKVITKGYPPHEKILSISGNTAYIKTDASPYDYSLYSQVIGGSTTGKNPATPIGRNLVGVDSTGKKMYILISDYMCGSNAESTITNFGAVNFIHLDGSGSARLKSEGFPSKEIPSTDSRTIPHAIAILTKSQQDVVLRIDSCLRTFNSSFGAKVGSLHSDCGTGSTTLFCQSSSAGKSDPAKFRKIGISTDANPSVFWAYSDSAGWKTYSLSYCK